jgi:hypothetical protein
MTSPSAGPALVLVGLGIVAYIPIVSMLVVSVVLTLLLNLISRLF